MLTAKMVQKELPRSKASGNDLVSLGSAGCLTSLASAASLATLADEGEACEEEAATFIEVLEVTFDKIALGRGLRGDAMPAKDAILALSEEAIIALQASFDADPSSSTDVGGFKIVAGMMTAKMVKKELPRSKAAPKAGTKTRGDETGQVGDGAGLALSASGPPKFSFPLPGSIEGVKSGMRVLLESKNMSFRYSEDKDYVIKDANLKLSTSSRVSISGPSGCDKSMLMSLLCGEASPSENKDGTLGDVSRHCDLRMAYMRQDHLKTLDPFVDKSPLVYITERFKAAGEPLPRRAVVKHCEAFGIEEDLCCNRQIRDFSAGQKVRLSLATLFWTKPHLIALDEPTTDLDAETVEALAEALSAFKGGVVMIESKTDLVERVCTEKWHLEDGAITMEKLKTGAKR